jgi:hypothetical protein
LTTTVHTRFPTCLPTAVESTRVRPDTHSRTPSKEVEGVSMRRPLLYHDIDPPCLPDGKTCTSDGRRYMRLLPSTVQDVPVTLTWTYLLGFGWKRKNLFWKIFTVVQYPP